jgi:hypothetical protein
MNAQVYSSGKATLQWHYIQNTAKGMWHAQLMNPQVADWDIKMKFPFSYTWLQKSDTYNSKGIKILKIACERSYFITVQ